MDLFIWPWMFMLLPLPVLAVWLLPPVWHVYHSMTEALQVPFFNRIVALDGVSVGGMVHPFWISAGLAWMCLVVSVARPVVYDNPHSIPLKARNILMAVDASGSMAEQDFDINGRASTRLAMLKSVAKPFIQSRAGDHIGLVLFGSEAYPYAPLTTDTMTLTRFLDEIDIGIAGEMTALGDALALSVEQVLNVPAASRMVILMSDGYANAGVVSVDKAVQLAQKHQVKVYTVGIGSDAVQIRDIFGPRVVNPAVDLDEKTLTDIANATGGAYFRAKTTDDLKQIYALINQLEPQEQLDAILRPRQEIFYIPLLGGLVFLLITYIGRRRVS